MNLHFNSMYYFFASTPFRVFFNVIHPAIFTSVFHRILDFKAGLDFYPGPLFFNTIEY